MTIFVVAVASACAVAVVACFVLGRGHPEGAAGHGPAATETTSQRATPTQWSRNASISSLFDICDRPSMPISLARS